MTQYNSLNVKLSNSQLNKLKSVIKNETEVFLRLSSNVICNSDDETNFPNKLLLTNRQIEAFANHLSTYIKLSKTHLCKMIQSGEFIGRLLGPLLKSGLPLMKNVLQLLAKSVVIPLGLTASASRKKMLGSGTITLIIENKELEDIMKIIKSLEDSGLLIKGVSETIQIEAKEQKVGFLGMLLGALGASALGNILAGK